MAEFISFGYRIIWISLLALVSYIFRRRLAGHLLSIQRISLGTLSLHGVEYSGTLYSNAYAFTFTTPMVTLRLQIPSSSEPLWLTLTVYSIFFTSTTCDISTAKLKVVLWFFPLLQRRTAGPWADVALEDLVIKVHSSTQTPYWIQKLRQNVVGAVLAGEILRVDDFWTSIRFANLSEPMANPQDQSSASDDERRKTSWRATRLPAKMTFHRSHTAEARSSHSKLTTPTR
ncbi:hypothetical protein A0H81_11440 [Grifola frondosa]|uniref:Uncharacterized protein n=1 Tax=Grifola frondosa TaxID=5627 RepID=A0A1C7LUI1_GRIFR|nr:hypothetical protein A0H81_11440 [Grifola frondosa]